MRGSKGNQLKNLIREGIKITDRAVEENEILKKRVEELEGSCEVFSKVEKESHRFLGFKQGVKRFFS